MSEVKCIEIPKSVGYVNLIFAADDPYRKALRFNVSIIKNSDFWGVIVTDPNKVSTIKTGDSHRISDIEFEVDGETFTMTVIEEPEIYIIIWVKK